MEVKILRGGMLTTVQDLGRRGHRAAGVPLSGAADPFALRVVNSLVGNAENAAALEFTLIGPELEFSTDAVIAVGGAECEGLPGWKPMAIPAGRRVKTGGCVHGCRGYIAIAGGIEVEPVLGSASTYLRGGLGGFHGRAIREGDVLKVALHAPTRAELEPESSHLAGNSARLVAASATWSIDPRVLPPYSASPTIRVTAGAQLEEFGDTLFASDFKILPQSDRMGLRLAGPFLARKTSAEILSSAVAPGTVQISHDGQPFVLLADAQTIGGYPQAAHVIAVDLPLVAQLRPGDTMRFALVPLEEAQRLAIVRDHTIAILREGLAQKLGVGTAGSRALAIDGDADTLRG